MKTKDETFDIRYVKSLIDDISEANKNQSETLVRLEKIAVETNGLLKSHQRYIDENKSDIKEHDKRIRAVERKQDGCTAVPEVKEMKTHIQRLLSFKDMIMSKANEDSTVIDVHAERMKAAVEAAKLNLIPGKVWIIKTLPWMIIVFVVGIVLATIVTIKAVSDEKVSIPVPKIEVTNSSSHESEGKK